MKQIFKCIRNYLIHILGGYTKADVERIRIQEFREASGFWHDIKEHDR